MALAAVEKRLGELYDSRNERQKAITHYAAFVEQWRDADAELQEVLEYLATHFKGEAMAPLNLNRATSIELEAVVGMLRRESKAWMTARQKAPCATLDDLRKVDGVDFAKVEKRRDRLVCF